MILIHIATYPTNKTLKQSTETTKPKSTLNPNIRKSLKHQREQD
jgi:hypothetical protein